MKKIFLILTLSITAQHTIKPFALPLALHEFIEESIKEIKNFKKKYQDPFYYELTKKIPSCKKYKKATKKYVSSFFDRFKQKTWCRIPTKEELKNAKNKVPPKL